MKSIFHKLLITFILLSIVPILCITYISYSNSSSILNNTIGSSLQQTVTQINTSTETMLISVENIINTMLFEDLPQYDYNLVKSIMDEYSTYNNYSKQVKKKELENYLTKFSTTQRYIQSINIVGQSGFSFSSSTEFLDTRRLELLNWYTGFMNSDKNVEWTELHNTFVYNNSTNSNVISYMKKVSNRVNTRDLGIIWVDISERWFSNIYDKMGITPSSQVFIINDKGSILSKFKSSSLSGNVSGLEYLKPVFENDKGFYVGKVNGIDMIFAYDILYKTQWKTVYMTPVNEVMEPYKKEKDSIIIIAFILLLVISIIILLVSFSISFPLKDLMKLMKQASAGDFKVRASVKSKDEVGQLCGMFNRMIDDIDNLIKQVYKAQTRQKEAELISLQSQINPHFLYNTLQTIKWLADSHKAPDIAEIAMSLARILRFSIKADALVSIRDEINNTVDYITIQKYRFEDRFFFEWDIAEDVYDIKVPSLIMQPIVENAILHGLEMKKGKGIIRIICKKGDKKIIIRVCDNGIGMKEGKLKEIRDCLRSDTPFTNRASIGMKNICDRLKLIYGEEAFIDIESLENIETSITISIPFKELNITNKTDILSTLSQDINSIQL